MTSQPALFVGIAFALLWLAVLCQIPLAAATALIGLGCAAIPLSLNSTGRVFASDAMEFLTNWQVATLPMFLMMGSFAVAAGHLDRYLPAGQRCSGPCAGRAGLYDRGRLRGFWRGQWLVSGDRGHLWPDRPARNEQAQL